MNVFEIHKIRYGWFEVCFTPHDEKQGWLCNSDYLQCDAPKLFLDALTNVLEGISQEEWLCWQDEPGANILQLALQDGKVAVEIFIAPDSMELPYRGAELASVEKEFEYRNSFEIKRLIDDVLVEFSLYENGNGLALYNKHWDVFPEKEFQRLKRFAARFNKGLDKYNKLFCLTY
ncbi:MAG: hypothetical protein K2N56_01755 [Oscillospiraceae bacterium]|nr:hypothetical protein [Oscillospiraceae bacterium]